QRAARRGAQGRARHGGPDGGPLRRTRGAGARRDRGGQPLPAAFRQPARGERGHEGLGRQRALAPRERVCLVVLARDRVALFVVHLPASRAPRILASARLILLFTVPSGSACRSASSECGQPPKTASSARGRSPSSRAASARPASSAGTGSGSVDIATW